MEKPISIHTWVKTCLQKVVPGKEGINASPGRAFTPCSVCYYAFDACSEYLETHQNLTKRNQEMGGLSLGAQSITSVNLHSNEHGDTKPTDKHNGGLNEVLTISSNELHSSSASSISRSSSSRSRLSSYSSVTTSSTEDHAATFHGIGKKEINICNGASINNFVNSFRQDALDFSLDTPFPHSIPSISSSSADLSTKAEEFTTVFLQPPQSKSDISNINTAMSTSNEKMDTGNPESESISTEQDLGHTVPDDVPEENDCELFDQYMREIYATNIQEPKGNDDVQEELNEPNMVVNRVKINTNSGQLPLNEDILENKQRGDNEYGLARNIFSPSLKSIWNVLNDKKGVDPTDKLIEKQQNGNSPPKHSDFLQNCGQVSNDNIFDKGNSECITEKSQSNLSKELLEFKAPLNAIIDDRVPLERLTGKSVSVKTIGTNTEPDMFLRTTPQNHCPSHLKAHNDKSTNLMPRNKTKGYQISQKTNKENIEQSKTSIATCRPPPVTKSNMNG